MKKRVLLLALCFSLIASIFAGCGGGGADENTITVAGKAFTEGQLMAEVFAQLIEGRTDINVERVFDLSSRIAFEATVQGETDIYPGYTGSLLMNYLNQEIAPGTTGQEMIRRAQEGILEEFDLVVLDPMGFQNNFAVAIDRPFAEENGIVTLSDLIPFAPDMIFGGEHSFFDRPDGFYGMIEAYGLNFADTRMMDVGLKYQSFDQGVMQAFIVYTTDSHIAERDLAILEDNRRFFPEYFFHPVVRRDTLERFPEIGEALSVLVGVATEDDMIRFNHLVDSGQMTIPAAAAAFIAEFGLLD